MATTTPVLCGDPSPQSMLAVKSAVVANVLASVKVPTTVEAGSATPVLGVSRVAAPAVSAASAMVADPATTVDAPCNIDHCDRVGVGPFLGVRVGGIDGPDDTVGRADGGEVGWRPRFVAPSRRPS